MKISHNKPINIQEKHLSKSATTSKPKNKNVAPHKDTFSKKEEEKGFIDKVTDKIANFIRKNIIGPAGDFTELLRKDFTTQAVTTGTLIGGTTGAIIGYEAAKYELNNAKTVTLQWQEPVMHDKYLGNIPKSHYQYTWGLPFWSDTNSFEYDEHGNLIRATHGIKPVYGEAPVYTENGSIKMHTVEKTITSQRFGMFGGIMGGLTLGAIGGALAGITISILHKMIGEEKPTKTPKK